MILMAMVLLVRVLFVVTVNINQVTVNINQVRI